jgi:flagellar biogenesis protein FliO
MKRSHEMHVGEERTVGREMAVAEEQGLAGWVTGLLRGWRGQREVKQKEMRLVEMLPLGGKRQLMLVSCGEERFLVGGGLESIETIVRLSDESSPKIVAKNPDELCL